MEPTQTELDLWVLLRVMLSTDGALAVKMARCEYIQEIVERNAAAFMAASPEVVATTNTAVDKIRTILKEHLNGNR